MSHETATNHANTFLELASKVMDGSLNRRQAMQKGAALGLSVPAMMALGAVGNRPKAAAPEPTEAPVGRDGRTLQPGGK